MNAFSGPSKDYTFVLNYLCTEGDNKFHRLYTPLERLGTCRDSGLSVGTQGNSRGHISDR
jgi:hypothetical protein